MNAEAPGFMRACISVTGGTGPGLNMQRQPALYPRPRRTQASQLRPPSWGFRASAGSAGWAGAHGLPSDPGWAARAQHPSLTPSITGDDKETEATGCGRLSSDPEPGGPSEPSRSWPGNILQQTPCGKPKGQKDHGRDPAGGPCLLARPGPACPGSWLPSPACTVPAPRGY